MLIEFRVENHRSLRDEQALTMRAGGQDDPADGRPRRVQGCADALLPAAALYGANASGKSNVLSALGFMRSAVLGSHRAWAPDEGIPREPFAWGEKALEASLFEITLLVAGTRYQYGFVADDEQFLEEWLYAWPGKRKQTWFTRELGKFKFSEHLGGENRLIEEVTRPNALFLSAAVQLRHQQLAPLYGWFRRLHLVNVRHRRSWLFRGYVDPSSARVIEGWLGSEAEASLFDESDGDEEQSGSFRDLLRAADVGILDIKVERQSSEPAPATGLTRPMRSRVLLRHNSSVEDAWLPLEEESQGTLTLFRVGPLMLNVLQTGGVVLVDELESNLHPLLAIQILRMFNDPQRNPHSAQILFTTHDTTLLGTIAGDPAMRRDQVWLTEKDQEGATVLYPLTDFKPRKDENIERGYLQGRYGAIPFLGALAKIGGGTCDEQ
jgi:predicted ATPase